MDSAIQDKVDRAFEAVMTARENGAPSPVDTISLLGLCGGDEDVRREVQSLLRHLDAAGADEPAAKTSEGAAGAAQSAAASDLPASPGRAFLNPRELHGSKGIGLQFGADALLREWGGEAIGQRVDGFTIIGKLGEGGMGVVYVAEQQNPRRTVALKVVRRGVATNQTLKRFEREAQLLGRLNHPGIAQIYAAGIAYIAAADGSQVRTPYIAMELVDGASILQYVVEHQRDPRLILSLVAQVCDAIQHAHQRGVIHRDLKPANILIAGTGTRAAAMQPGAGDGPAELGSNDVILSAAKDLQSESRNRTPRSFASTLRMTGSGNLHDFSGATPHVKVLDFGVGRPVGEKMDPTAATDLTLYGHLIGTLAYMAPEQLAPNEELDTRCDVYSLGVILYNLLTGKFPIDVSDCGIAEAARRIAEHEPAPLWSAPGDTRFANDLETIVGKATQKDRSRRYQSPLELARDIRLYLAGEPIEAKRDSLLYVMRRQAARYRTLSLGVLIALAAVVGFALYARVQASRQAVARAEADAARVRADQSAAVLATELSAAHIEQGRLLGQTGDVRSAERFLWDELLAHPDSRPARWALWELYSHTRCLRTIHAHEGETRGLSFDRANVTRAATGGDDGYVRFWSVPAGDKLSEIKTPLGPIRAVQFSSDGARLVAGGEQGVAIYDANTRELLRLIEHPALKPTNSVDISRDGQIIASVGEAGIVQLWSAADGTALATINPHSADQRVNGRTLRFDATGSRLAAGFDDGMTCISQLTGGREKLVVTPGATIPNNGFGIISVSFSPDGQCLACGVADANVYLWNPDTGAAIGTIDTHNGTPRAVSFSQDGSKLAVVGLFRSMLCDVATRQPWTPPDAESICFEGGSVVGFSNDGRYVFTGGTGTLRIWELTNDQAVVTLDAKIAAAVRGLDVSSIGNRVTLAAAHVDGTVTVHSRDISPTTMPTTQPAADAWYQRLQLHTARATAVAISPDGAQILVGGRDGHIRSFDATSGQPLGDFAAHDGAANDVRFTPDGSTLITCGSDGMIKLWHRRSHGAATSWEPGPTQQRDNEVLGLGMGPDGKYFVATERHTKFALWSIPDLHLIRLIDTKTPVWKPAFSPDGRWISIGLWHRAIQMWSGPTSLSDASNVHLASRLIGHTLLISCEAFNADSTLLASAAPDGLVKIWDVAALARPEKDTPEDSRRCLATLIGHAGEAYAAVFLPPPLSYRLAIGYRDGSVRIWDLHHYDQHLAGQRDYQLRLRAAGQSQ